MSNSAITGPVFSDVRRSPSGSAAAPSWSFADSTGTGVYLVSAGVLGLSTNGVQRVVVDAAGKVGIGTASPGSKLDVSSGSSGVVLNLNGVNAYDAETGITLSQGRAKISGYLNTTGGTPGSSLRFYTMPDNGSISERMRIDGSGNLLVGRTNSSSARLVVTSSGTTSSTYCFLMENPNGGVLAATDNGTIYTGTLSGSPYNLGTGTPANLVVFSSGGLGRSTSALKYKKDIEDLPYGLDAILGMKPIQYKSKCEIDAPDQKFIGFIADWEKQRLPELVTHNEEGEVEDFAYSRLTAVTVKAIQELKAELDEAKAKIAALESKP